MHRESCEGDGSHGVDGPILPLSFVQENGDHDAEKCKLDDRHCSVLQVGASTGL